VTSLLLACSAASCRLSSRRRVASLTVIPCALLCFGEPTTRTSPSRSAQRSISSFKYRRVLRRTSRSGDVTCRPGGGGFKSRCNPAHRSPLAFMAAEIFFLSAGESSQTPSLTREKGAISTPWYPVRAMRRHCSSQVIPWMLSLQKAYLKAPGLWLPPPSSREAMILESPVLVIRYLPSLTGGHSGSFGRNPSLPVIGQRHSLKASEGSKRKFCPLRGKSPSIDRGAANLSCKA
jgi:hypothetical protein